MALTVTDRLNVSARPSFKVDGNAEPRLGVDLIELEASEDEEGIARLEARFLNWSTRDAAAPPGFAYFDGAILDLGKEIEVTAGADDAQDVIFKGQITAIEAVFPERSTPEIVVRAEDALMWLRMREHSRTHEQSTDSDIASTVLSDDGLSADASAQGPSHVQLWQVNQGDLAFLRERARAVDARLAVVDDQVSFAPRRGDGGEPVTLSRVGSLLHFEVSADLAHQRKEVHVHGWSVADKEGIHESAGESEVSAEADGGRTGPGVLGELGIDAVEHLSLDAPTTSEEASTLAIALARKRGRRFVFGRGLTDGTPTIHIGITVRLTDLGPWFSGNYHVTTVRHTFDQRVGLRTWFEVERAGLGRS